MDDLKQILIFLNRVEKLKTVQRKVSISNNSRKESPAEHSWRVALMAMILHRELKLKVDLLKTLEVVLVHDIVEAIAGDVWILNKNDVNAHNIQQKKELEAAESLYNILPDASGSSLKSLWLEYEYQTSAEAKFAKALDKIEVIIQRCDLGAKNWESRDIYPILLHWADESVNNFPELKDLWKIVQEELESQQLKSQADIVSDSGDHLVTKNSMKIPIVNENDIVIDYKDRGLVAQEDIYRVSALWITNRKSEILLAQRALTKAHNPGKWGPAVAGTVEEGEEYVDNIRKEATEEIGLENITPTIGPKIRMSGEYNYFCQWYLFETEEAASEFVIDPIEVQKVKWFTQDELLKEMENHPEQFLKGMDQYVKLFCK